MQKSYLLILFLISVFFLQLSTANAQTWKDLTDSTKFYQDKNDNQTALKWAKLALVQAEKVFDKTDTNYLFTLRSVSEIFYSLVKIDSAIYYGDIHLKICRNLYKNDNSELALSIANFGSFHNANGDYDIAEQLLKESLSMYRRIFKDDHQLLANSINKLADYYSALGNYPQATPLYLETLEMRRKLFKADHPDLAISLNDVATSYYIVGDVKKAEPLFVEAYNMFKRLFHNDHPNLAQIMGTMAKIYFDRGEYEKAEPLYVESVAMYRRLFNFDHPDLAYFINALGGFYYERGEFQKAEPLLVEALDMNRRLFKKDNPELARCIIWLGSFYFRFEEFDKAEPLLVEGYEMRKRLYKAEHADIINSLIWMAVLSNAKKEFSKAEEFFKQALDMNRKLYNIVHPTLADNILHFARFYNERKEYQHSAPLFIELIQVCSDLIDNYFPTLSEKEKDRYFSTLFRYYRQFNNFAVLHSQESPKLLETMYDNQLLTKGMLLNSSNNVRCHILASNDSSLIQLFSSWKDKKEYLSKLYSMTNSQLKQKHANLDSIINLANNLEKELTKRSESFKKEYDKQKFKCQDIQNSLAKGEAAVEIVRITHPNAINTLDSVYYAGLIIKQQGGVELVFLRNGLELESSCLQKYKEELQNDNDNKTSYNAFWAEIAKKLNQVKKVYISPDGVYNQLNLATLKNPQTKKYLDDEIEMTILTSTRDILKVKTEQNIRNVAFELFGDPTFDYDANKLMLASNEPIAGIGNVESFRMEQTLDSSTRDGVKLQPLPRTRDEISEISKIIKASGNEYNIHLGEEATEEAVKSVNNPKVLHLATHGHFLKDIEQNKTDSFAGIDQERATKNPLLRSMLFFTGAKKSIESYATNNYQSTKEDGILTAYEAQNLNLDNTELVVLAACETGLGEIKNGEGVYGLQRAFIQAGAKTLIMSLWNANDKVTKEIMTTFYKEWLKGKSKNEAFRIAKKKIREQYRYPIFWGCFVMVGG